MKAVNSRSDACIHVAICLDERVLTAAMVLIISLKRIATAMRPIEVHVVMSFQSPAFEQYIGAIVSDDFVVSPIYIVNSFKHLGERAYITQGMYYRFLLADLLPDLDKILYLDTDVIVMRDLAALFDLDISDVAVAAVRDHALLSVDLIWKGRWVEYLESKYAVQEYLQKIVRLSESAAQRYFNCGVLLMNLDVWRRQEIGRKSADFVQASGDLRFPDQDALNHVLAGNYLALDPRWNAFAESVGPIKLSLRNRWGRQGREWIGIRRQWLTDPWILHYAGPNKPWSATDAATLLDARWWEVAAHLPTWSDMKARHIAEARASEKGISKIPAHLV